jgi:SAM-dependent methyltransferase
MSRYVMDNAAAQAEQRFEALQACYDPVTIRQLEAIGVAPGWSCLEVGAGGGSIAGWLADRVTPGGRVVVTDIDPRWLEARGPNIELRRHDIAADELEREAFDLAHERLVLLHLPQRARALRRMIGSLRPGGWLLIEDFDCSWLPLGPYGTPAQADLFRRVIGALHHVLERAGLDMAYGRRFHGLLRQAGLADVHVEGHIVVSAGGSPGATLVRANLEQLRGDLAGVSGEEVDRCCELLEDPDFSFSYQPMMCGRGRRPGRARNGQPEEGRHDR